MDLDSRSTESGPSLVIFLSARISSLASLHRVCLGSMKGPEGPICQRRLKKLQTWRVKMLHPAEVTSL